MGILFINGKSPSSSLARMLHNAHQWTKLVCSMTGLAKKSISILFRVKNLSQKNENYFLFIHSHLNFLLLLFGPNIFPSHTIETSWKSNGKIRLQYPLGTGQYLTLPNWYIPNDIFLSIIRFWCNNSPVCFSFSLPLLFSDLFQSRNIL